MQHCSSRSTAHTELRLGPPQIRLGLTGHVLLHSASGAQDGRRGRTHRRCRMATGGVADILIGGASVIGAVTTEAVDDAVGDAVGDVATTAQNAFDEARCCFCSVAETSPT
jgi:hypothetical protein